MKINLLWLWYDLWIGAYWDRAARTLYLCPIPTVVIRIRFGPAPGPSTDEQVSKLVWKIGMGQPLLPDPELDQDVAFLAFNIESKR